MGLAISTALTPVFNQNGDKVVTLSEFEKGLEALGNRLKYKPDATNHQEAKDIFSDMDANGDGKVSLAESIQYFSPEKTK